MSDDVEYTPTPWEVTEMVSGYTVRSTNDKYAVSKGIAKVDSKGDAYLIAAAPELLEVAKQFLQYEHGVDDPGQFMDDIEAAKKAIAKAEGRS
jgi:hypothetical protein